MTYRRCWGKEYLSDLNALESGLRTKVRSMTTLLAGNPYLPPSVAVKDAVRAIDVQHQAVLVYRIDPRAVLTFLLVRSYDSASPADVSAALDARLT